MILKDRYVEARPHTLEALTLALSDEIRTRSESMMARDRRFQGEVDELRTTLGVAHRAILTVKHELERRSTPDTTTMAGVPDAVHSAPATSLN